MKSGILIIILFFQVNRSYGCYPRRPKGFTDSYIPACIQALHHYKIQLKQLYPESFSRFCKSNLSGTTGRPKLNLTGIIGSNGHFFFPFPKCADETLGRMNYFLILLKREAENQNMDDFQGFSQNIIKELEKTSEMTGAEQLYFFLTKIQDEEIENNAVICQITKFMEDLENCNSKLSENFQSIKPLKYAGERMFR